MTDNYQDASSLPTGAGRRYRWSREQRLRSPREFERVYTEGRSAADSHVVVYAARNGTSRARLGLSVGRKLGPAVQRNRYRRTLREAFRLQQHDLPQGFDYILIPRSSKKPCSRVYAQSLLALCRRLQRRIENQNT